MKLIRSYFSSKELVLIAACLCITIGLHSNAAAQSPPNIDVDGKLASDNASRGRTVRGTVTMNIPAGYHVNSNRPLEKFLIATQLQIEAPGGVRVGPSVYPRPLIRSLKFSKNKVAVFEGQTPIRFTVTVLPGFSGDSVELKGKLRYQSCSDDVCFPPKSREFSLWLKVR